MISHQNQASWSAGIRNTSTWLPCSWTTSCRVPSYRFLKWFRLALATATEDARWQTNSHWWTQAQWSQDDARMGAGKTQCISQFPTITIKTGLGISHWYPKRQWSSTSLTSSFDGHTNYRNCFASIWMTWRACALTSAVYAKCICTLCAWSTASRTWQNFTCTVNCQPPWRCHLGKAPYQRGNGYIILINIDMYMWFASFLKWNVVLHFLFLKHLPLKQAIRLPFGQAQKNLSNLPASWHWW